MADQEYRDSIFIKQDSRENFKQIIAKRSDLAKFAGGRIIPAPTTTPVMTYAGTVLGYAATGANAGKYVPYVAGATDGSQVPVGVLSEDCLTDNLGNGSEISVLLSATVFQASLIGLDTNAITVLGAKSYTEHGTQLLSF
jgi:hypothetical protein